MSFLITEEDGNAYIYEYESNTRYNRGEIICANNVFYRAEKTFISSTSVQSDFSNGNLSVFNKLDMEGSVNLVGPQNAQGGRNYATQNANLNAPQDHVVVGYRIYGNGANNYPDGGSTGFSMAHYLYTKKIKRN
jgi:hypothetical protein